jgi:hypothetical protein
MEEFLAIGIDLSEGSSYEVSCPLAKTAHEVAKLIVSTPKSTPKPKPKPK